MNAELTSNRAQEVVDDILKEVADGANRTDQPSLAGERTLPLS
jgi:hypothetical protein